MHAESEKEFILKSILQRLIGHLCEHHSKWRQSVPATVGMHTLLLLSLSLFFRLTQAYYAHTSVIVHIDRMEYVTQIMVLFFGKELYIFSLNFIGRTSMRYVVNHTWIALFERSSKAYKRRFVHTF